MVLVPGARAAVFAVCRDRLAARSLALGEGLCNRGCSRVLRTGFERIGLSEIVSFTTVLNARSWAVMERLGMWRDEDFDYPAFPEGHRCAGTACSAAP